MITEAKIIKPLDLQFPEVLANHYFSTIDGEIYCLKSNGAIAPMKTHPKNKHKKNSPNRVTVRLKDPNRHKRNLYIHRIVATLFCPNQLKKTDVHHIDHDKFNNHPSNLLWVTKEQHQECHRLMKSNDEAYQKLIMDILYENLDADQGSFVPWVLIKSSAAGSRFKC